MRILVLHVLLLAVLAADARGEDSPTGERSKMSAAAAAWKIAEAYASGGKEAVGLGEGCRYALDRRR